MSPRKRTPDKESTEATTAVADAPVAETPIAVAEPPAQETEETKRRKRLVDPFQPVENVRAVVKTTMNQQHGCALRPDDADQRVGIIRVSMGLLAELLNFPPDHRIIDVRRRGDAKESARHELSS